MNFFKKLDNFIVNRFNLKQFLYLLFAFIFMNGFTYFVLKYKINTIDNLLMVMSLDLSLLYWFKFLDFFKKKE